MSFFLWVSTQLSRGVLTRALTSAVPNVPGVTSLYRHSFNWMDLVQPLLVIFFWTFQFFSDFMLFGILQSFSSNLNHNVWSSRIWKNWSRKNLCCFPWCRVHGRSHPIYYDSRDYLYIYLESLNIGHLNSKPVPGEPIRSSPPGRWTYVSGSDEDECRDG